VRVTAAPPPPEAGDPPGLSEIEFPEAAPTGELPPIANLVLDPPRADVGAQSGETRPAWRPAPGQLSVPRLGRLSPRRTASPRC